MKVYLEAAFTCHECGVLLWLLETIETGVKNLHHPVVSCSASGQQFERPTIELKEIEG